MKRLLATYVVHEGMVYANHIVSINSDGSVKIEPFRSETAFTEFHNAVALCGRYSVAQFSVDETLSLCEIASQLLQQTKKIAQDNNSEPQIYLFGE